MRRYAQMIEHKNHLTSIHWQNDGGRSMLLVLFLAASLIFCCTFGHLLFASKLNFQWQIITMQEIASRLNQSLIQIISYDYCGHNLVDQFDLSVSLFLLHCAEYVQSIRDLNVAFSNWHIACSAHAHITSNVQSKETT